MIVTAAGNASTSDGGCKQNPDYDAANNGADLDNWDNVTTLSMPSYYSPLVISVGGTDMYGQAYPATMTGPWVDVAAPAMNIVSLDASKRSGGLANGLPSDKEGPQPIHGTSYASAYVAGLAALIRERYPEMNAQQVRDQIVQTALTPSTRTRGALGAGVVDPVAALTDVDVAEREDGPLSRAAVIADPAPDYGWIKSVIAIGGTGLAVVAAMVLIGWNRLRRVRQSTKAPSAAELDRLDSLKRRRDRVATRPGSVPDLSDEETS